MKKLHKIIALFSFIFFTGILIAVITINTSLNKTEITKETIEVQKDTIYLLKVENKTI
jgi:hypothetical protein|tara:strand:+ start:564 stop:737 length:174 start_codon:yes stop_codon:yes gene_type:complete